MSVLLLYSSKIRLRRWGFSHLIIAVQLVLITAQFVVFGASRFLPRWQARGLDVTIIRVNNGSMCPPLIEGDIAFMAQYQMYEGGVIYQINIYTGEIIREISLPTCTPEQLGHPDWVDDGTALRVHQAVITRLDDNTLQLQYPTGFYTADWAARVDIPLSVRLTVDLDQSLVVNWEKFEGEEAQAGFDPSPDYFREVAPRQAQVGVFSVFWTDAKLYFESPDNCYLLRCGLPFWMLAVDDSTLLMDQSGYIYIIKVKEAS